MMIYDLIWIFFRWGYIDGLIRGILHLPSQVVFLMGIWNGEASL